jgi:mono/diheme cytochrome c family protein
MIRHALAISAALFTVPLAASAQTSSSSDAGPTRGSRAWDPDGAGLYQERCASCHGKTGRGDGEYAGLLNPRPRDFTGGRFKVRSTDTGNLPTDEDLAHSITEGLHGTSMATWKAFLKPEQVQALVAEVKSFSPRFADEHPQSIAIGPEVPDTEQNAEEGRAVYEKLRCAACHGTDGHGTGAIAQAMRDDWGQPTRATNLTEPWTFRGGTTVRDIFLRFRTGMNGTPMPSFLGAATEPELWQLAVYVKALARKPLWEMTGDEVAVFYRDQQQHAAKDILRQGEYIAAVTGCVFCHSPYRDDNTMMDKFKYAGGQKFEVTPFGTFVSYNLTSDKETGLGRWTDDQIKTFVTRGVRPDGSRMIPYPMPWPNYASLKADDLNALIAFLRSVPPVSNLVPAPRPANIVSYLTGKFRMLIRHHDPPVYRYPGNAGNGGQQ